MIPAETRAVLERHTKSAPVDVQAIAKELGIKIFSAKLPEKISGVLRRDSSYKSKSGFVILVNREEPAYRQRFTAAHELGHFVLHRDCIGEGVEDNFFLRAKGMSSRQEEEANEFAASLLIPADLLESEMELGKTTVSKLAEKFKVSPTTMSIRLGLHT